MTRNKNGGQRPGAKTPLTLGRKPQPKKFSQPLDFSDQPRLNAPRKPDQKPAAQPNQRMGEFLIERISHDGRGVTQWQGKTLFVEGALPGERVSARFLAEHGRYVEAVADNIIQAAPERQNPPCPHFADCGGCQVQHLTDVAQIAFKQAAVLDQLQRWAKITPQHLLPPITASSKQYRSSARLGVWYEKEGAVILGFRQKNNKVITPIQTCSVLPAQLNQLIAPLHEWLTRVHTAKAVTHIELFDNEGAAAVILRHTKPLTERELQGLREVAQQHLCTIWLDDGGQHLQDLHHQVCDPRLHYALPQFGLNLAYHPKDFIQVNASVNTQMLAQAIALLQLQPHERVLDLFCGIGNFTLPIAQHCAQVTGIEAVEAMVERGRENAAQAGVSNAHFMAADLTQLSAHQIQQRCGSTDTILLDPPRDGAKAIMEQVGRLGARRILYVSCNPATFARDAKILADSGHRLHTLGVMDMFPHTAHVEVMGLFVRR